MIRQIEPHFGKGRRVGASSDSEGSYNCPGQSRETELNSLICADPFYTRILSLYESYGGGYDFVGFWIQETDGKICSAISRFEDKFSLFLTDDSDLEEIAFFLRFQGAGAVMSDARFNIPLSGSQIISGQVLRYSGEDYISDKELYPPDFDSVYRLLQTCESPIFRVPPRLVFLSDVTHRSNLGKCTVLGINVDDVLASSVMTVSETSHAAILGAVATHPDYRKRGLSRELVRTLASQIAAQGRAAYVFSASDANTRFYENSGFKIVAGFREIIGSLS